MPPTFGIRIESRHCNSGGTAHGGLLVALADLALGQGIRAVAGRDVRLVTAGLSADFTRPIAVGHGTARQRRDLPWYASQRYGRARGCG